LQILGGGDYGLMNNKWQNKELERIYLDVEKLLKKINIEKNDMLVEDSSQNLQQLIKLIHLKSSILRLDQGERRLLNKIELAYISLVSFVITLITNLAIKFL